MKLFQFLLRRDMIAALPASILTADTAHRLVVLDGPSGLKVDDLTGTAAGQAAHS